MNRNIVVNIGEQRFNKLREGNSLYIDKTEFIREWWETGSTSTLITRPRRFGKTLNMSMLECFFSNEYKGRGDLFEGLSIWENGSPEEREKYRQLQGTYPVILEVVTTTSNYYATAFGFTEEEVFASLDTAGLGSEKQEVRRWYDGFTFGSHTNIYNPWSIMSFIKSGGVYDAYWTNTSGNGLVNALVQRGNADVKQTMEELLQGRSITARIDEQIVFNQLGDNADAVWSLLLATGYLKVAELEYVGRRKRKMYTLELTNVEVEAMFEDMVRGWFNRITKAPYSAFIRALLADNVEAMNEYMNKVAMDSFSNFDTAKGASDDDAPEKFYHGFVLGLMTELAGRFQITSNRESGFCRYDIMLKPTDKERDCAYIIEFKVHKPRKEKNLWETVANALSQIEEKQYEAVLTAEGFASGRIRKYGFAFRGKECLIG